MSSSTKEKEAGFGVPLTVPAQALPPVSRSDDAAALAWPVAKRTLDVVLALVALIVFAPVMVVIAALIKLDSRGPVLFRQQRYGFRQETFTVFKFRTMVSDAPEDAHRRYIAELAAAGGNGTGLKKLAADPRITRVGVFLRKSSLDELPQLINVLAGRMSLVGPRPAIEYELEHYDYAHYARFDVKPGLTGLWQVSGRSKLGFTEMLELDAEYARSVGPLTDAKILLRTPVEIFRGRCA